ncbi:MAG: family 43 glycosylhydrolase, partial [Acidimicrobiales bacterium]
LAALHHAVDVIDDNRDRDRSAADTASSAATDLASLRDQIAAGQATLAASEAQIGQQAGQISAMATCVETLDRARDQLSTNQARAATDELRAGTASCQFAEAIVKGPATANFPYDFADPYVMPVSDGYLAFSTNGVGGAIQMLSSTDSVSWKLEGTALTSLPPWAEPGHTWSPSVIATLNGYLLFYTVRDRATQKQCITTARSAQPTGPYVDTSAGPFICQPQLGGSIDASPTIVYGGGAFLLWKSEGETQHSVSRIWSQQFDPETLALIGGPAVLLSADRAWESGVIEGPSMTFVDGGWMLLYSGNHWGEPDYAVGYATCDSPMGPCSKPADNVALASGAFASGPGGAEFFHALDGSIGVAFAGWSPDAVGWPSPRRLFVRHVQPAPPGRIAIG